MQNSSNEFCSFCLKSSNQVNIIDTRTNSLLIDSKCYEFSTIFNDLLQYSSSDETICEICKDLMVSFYLFKRNIKFPQNHIYRLLIKTQIDEFLNQNASNIEDIKVIRTSNSITLQNECKEGIVSSESIVKKESDIIVQEIDYEDANDTGGDDDFEALVSYQCPKCDKVESSENYSEIHEFIKHSSFGAQMEVEIENSKVYNESADIEEVIYVCGFCTSQVESFEFLLLHLLNIHKPEVLFQINSILNVPSHLVEFPIINNYLNHIKECLQHERSNSTLDFEHKKYFFDIYGEFYQESNVSDQDIQEHEVEMSDITDSINVITKDRIKKEKHDKLGDDLSPNDKEWVRSEISRSKFIISSDAGDKRVIYRCSLSDSCNHVSNSAPGLRYHLIMKHLKHRKEYQEGDRPITNEILPESYQFVSKNSSKNCCIDCGLKFKDSRACQLHERCHELFGTVANYSNVIYPSCSTCNQKFVSEDHLQQHYTKHDNNEDLNEHIETAIGAVRQHGRIVSNAIQSYGETDVTDFSWKCGHCPDKHFIKEEFCNLHLLLFHTVTFVCPKDKMEFSGFKNVSLFIHHLRNKHSELFPNLSFTCTFCQMEFTTIYDKLNHMKHCDRKNLQCDHCDKRFWKKGDLIAHLKYITGEVQFECLSCGKKCISASDLKIHNRSHSKVKPYKCSLCTKTFRTLAARAAHMDAHNTNFIYVCEVCNKTFKQRQLYRRHMKTVHENKSTDSQ